MNGQSIVQFPFSISSPFHQPCSVILVPNDIVPTTRSSQRVTRSILVEELVVLQPLVQEEQALVTLGLMVTVLERPT